MSHNTVFITMAALAAVLPVLPLGAEETEESPRRVTEKSYQLLEEATVRLGGQPGLAKKDLATLQADLQQKEARLQRQRQTVVRLQRDMHKLRQRYANNPQARKEIEDTYRKSIAATKGEVAVLGERMARLRQRIDKQHAHVTLDSIYAKSEAQGTEWDKEYQAIASQRFTAAKDLIVADFAAEQVEHRR